MLRIVSLLLFMASWLPMVKAQWGTTPGDVVKAAVGDGSAFPDVYLVGKGYPQYFDPGATPGAFVKYGSDTNPDFNYETGNTELVKVADSLFKSSGVWVWDDENTHTAENCEAVCRLTYTSGILTSDFLQGFIYYDEDATYSLDGDEACFCVLKAEAGGVTYPISAKYWDDDGDGNAATDCPALVSIKTELKALACNSGGTVDGSCGCGGDDGTPDAEGSATASNSDCDNYEAGYGALFYSEDVFDYSTRTDANCAAACGDGGPRTPTNTDYNYEGYVFTGTAGTNTAECHCVSYPDFTTQDTNCNLLTTYCYGCMDDDVNGGELSPSAPPSGQPSSEPSGQPSSIPSEVPSGQPSSEPSGEPSSVPSEMPSGAPSEHPSQQPSSIPSESPSGEPSSVPSEMPSSTPSEMPSGQPSGQPSEAPSSIPSTQPTSQPSEIPSAQPSCTPSMAPTPPEETYLFYPDWSPGGEGCRNDGGEPAYMSANPSWYLYSTLDKCCNQHFGWNYDTCMGNLPGICSRALFYPDWEGSNEVCIDDGNEPPYMTDNAMYYMYSQLSDCCTEHFSWNYEECIGSTNRAYSNLWYPDWEGSNTGCKTGGGHPQYMNGAPEIWMFDNLEECCSTNYNWMKAECLGAYPTASGGTIGAAPATSPGGSGTGLFYPDWKSNQHICINDGNEPSYMKNSPQHWMHSTLNDCCKTNFAWNLNECMEYISSASSGTTPAASPTTPSTSPANGKFYMNWGANRCVQDCYGVSPCGGNADPWDLLYDTLDQCCKERNWWNDQCDQL